MEAKELRIGNYVNFKFHKDSGGIKKVEVFLSDIENLIHGGNRSKYYEPIPLTEDWLVKFGFKKGVVKLGCQEYWIDGVLGVYKMVGSYPHFAHGAINDIKLKHVHKLQNLYFALTNEELTIK